MDAGILKKLYSGSADLNKSVENINSTLDDLYTLQKKENKREQKEEAKKDKERRRKEQEAKRKAGDKKSFFDKMKSEEKKKDKKTISQMLWETVQKLGGAIMGILGSIGSVVGGSLLGAIGGLGLGGMLTAAIPLMAGALKGAIVAAAAWYIKNKLGQIGDSIAARKAAGKGKNKDGVEYSFQDIASLRNEFTAFQHQFGAVLDDQALRTRKMYNLAEDALEKSGHAALRAEKVQKEIDLFQAGDKSVPIPKELADRLAAAQEEQKAWRKKSAEFMAQTQVTTTDLVRHQIKRGRRGLENLPKGHTKRQYSDLKRKPGLFDGVFGTPRASEQYNDGPQKKQTGGMIQTLLEPGEKVFMPGQWEGTGIDTLNDIIPRFQTGGVVQGSHPHTGAGYSVGIDGHRSGNRPAIFSKGAAEAYMQMIKDSGGAVKTSDINSSKRSASYNKQVGGVPNSGHLSGNAADIQTGSSSWHWIKKNGGKYGWKFNNYMGPQGWHFDYNGANKDEGSETPTGEPKGDPSMSASSADQQQSQAGAGGLSLENLGGVGGFISGFMGQFAEEFGAGLGEIAKLVSGTAGGKGGVAGAAGFGAGVVETLLGAVGLGPGSDSPGAGPAAASGPAASHTQLGAGQAGDMMSGAKMIMNAGVPKRGAAYLAGNIQQESSWNGQRDWGQVMGDGTSRNGGLVSWASWSDDPARLGKIEKHLGKNIKEASDGEQINAMLWEMKREYPKAYGIFMNPKSSDADLKWASKRYWGYGHEGPRYSYAQQVLENMKQSGGVVRRQQGGIVNVTGGHSQTRARLQAAQEQFANRIVSATQRDPVVVFEDAGNSGTMVQEPSPYTQLPDLPDGPSTVQAAEYFYNVSLGGEL